MTHASEAKRPYEQPIEPLARTSRAWIHCGIAIALAVVLVATASVALEVLEGLSLYVTVLLLAVLLFGIPSFRQGRKTEVLLGQSLTDPLTGIGNRRALLSGLEQTLASCWRRQCSLAVLLIDVDRLKEINDELSHDAGDHALRAVALTLHQLTRRSDVVGRLGGDEFVVVAPDTSEESACLLAERLVSEVKSLSVLSPSHRRIGLSIGVTATRPERPPTANDLQALLNSADQAMYAHKHRTRRPRRHGRANQQGSHQIAVGH